jgi:hypothetical protein
MKKVIVKSKVIEFKRGPDQGRRKRRSDIGRKRRKRTYVGEAVREGAKWGAGFGGLVLATKALKNARGAGRFIKESRPKYGVVKPTLATGLVAGKTSAKVLGREALTTAGVFGGIAGAQMALSSRQERERMNAGAEYRRRLREERKRR